MPRLNLTGNTHVNAPGEIATGLFTADIRKPPRVFPKDPYAQAFCPGCAGESPAGVFRMQEEVRLDHDAYAPSRTELPTDVMCIGYSRHEKIPPGNPPAFESDGSGCRTGDRRVG